MDINQIISENLKRLRNERNLSLGQLSKLCQLSKVMLSQIEKGDTNPTINTLWKIAGGLRVPYTALLDHHEPITGIVKKDEADSLVEENGHFRTFCYYSNTPNRNFELFQIEADENCCYTSIGHSEKSQEYILVIEGQLTLTVNKESYTLGPNDSISFVATSQHTYSNSGKGLLKFVNINYYPV